MPFEYQPYVSPYANSIAEIMRHQGDPQAQALLAGAAARARAGEIGAQAWGGAVQNIGQSVAAIPQQMQQQRAQAEESQLRQARLAQEQQQTAAVAASQRFQEASNRIVSTLTQANPDGSRTLDRAKLVQQLSAANIPPAMQQTVLKSLDDVDASIAKFTATKVDHRADFAHAALQSELGKTPEGIVTLAGLAKANGLVTDDELKPIFDALAGGATPTAVLQAVRGLSEKYKDAEKPVILPEGGTLVKPSTGEVITTGAPKPKTEAELDAEAQAIYAKRASGQTLTPTETSSLAGYEARKIKPPEAQHVTFRLDGKDVPGSFVPTPTGGKYFYNGEDVTARVKAIPPASIQVNAAASNALANLPSWALDDSRPTGPDANKLDPTVRMTPNGLYQAAQNYIATGQFPQTGRGNDPAAQAVRAAVNAKVGAIAASSGMDEPALRAFYKSNASSLSQQQKSYDAVQSFMATADRNADKLKSVVDKIPDVGSPLLNRPLRAIDQKALGDVDLSQFRVYVQSVQNEYARIISQPNLAGQLTDSARHEAEQLVDPNATVAQILGSIAALRTEGENRLLSVGQQIQRIQQRLQTPTAGGPAPAVTAPTVNERWERGPDGKMRRVGG
jgi:hypothetical protein